MSRKMHIKGDLQVDGDILGPDGNPAGGGKLSYATFVREGGGAENLYDGSDIYPNVIVRHSNGDDIVLGNDKQTITVVPGLYEIGLWYRSAGGPNTLEIMLDGLDADVGYGDLARVPGVSTGTETLIVPILIETELLLNFVLSNNATGNVWFLLSIVKLSDL